MTEHTPFEARLSEQLDAESRVGIRPFDRYAIARSVIEARRPRAFGGIQRRWLIPLALTVLLLFAAAGLAAGGRLRALLEPAPPELVVVPTGVMSEARAGHAATVLPDGRVLVTGGDAGTACPDCGSRTAELFDPADGTFLRTGSMTTRRAGHVSLLLQDGLVLVIGGADGADLYDPSTGVFQSIGPALGPLDETAAVQLLDGRVLLLTRRQSDISGRVHLFDPATGTFAPAPDLTELARAYPSVVRLPDGRVVVAGRESSGASRGSPSRFDAGRIAVWDPSSDDIEIIQAPGIVRGMVLLADGRVLVELWDELARTDALALVDLDDQTVKVAAPLNAPAVLGPVTFYDRRVAWVAAEVGGCAHPDPSDAGDGPVVVRTMDDSTGVVDTLGTLPSFTSCRLAIGATLTSLPDGRALIAGGRDASDAPIDRAFLVTREDEVQP